MPMLKKRPSKATSWIGRAMASSIPLKVCFTKNNPADKKMMIIFTHDFEAEQVNANQTWFAPPWQEMCVDGENKWCLMVEAEPPGKEKKVEPPKKKPSSKPSSDDDSDESEEDPSQSGGESSEGEQDSSSEDSEEEKEMQKLKEEIQKEHNLWEKELGERTENFQAPDKLKPNPTLERPLHGGKNFGLTDICNCRACKIKKGAIKL